MTQLIPYSYLNEICFLSLNTDDKKYGMALDWAQDDLKEVLGVEFYDQIVTQYPNYSGDNLALYDPYIKKFLAWQTYAHYLKFAPFDATPTGLRAFKDDNSDLLDDVRQTSAEKNIATRATQMKNNIINFIRKAQANASTKYPLFKNKCDSGFSFGITSVDKRSSSTFSINKAITTNE
jgi:hypothetical protein